MKTRIILLTFFIASYTNAECISVGCNSIDEFADSYARAVADKNEELLKKHYYSEDYTCHIDKYYFEGSYTGYNVGEETVLKGEEWNHFELTWKSEATKVKLFYDFKESNPNESNSEVMRMAFKELIKPDTKRVELPMIAAPNISVPLSINGRIYHKDHPCMAYTGTSAPFYLIKTPSGLKAVEPMCDVSRATGKARVERDEGNTEGDKIYNSLSVHQVKHYKKLLEGGRISTVKQFAEDLSLNYKDAKYVILDKVCPLIL